MRSIRLPREVTVRLGMSSSSQVKWACYKKLETKWEAGADIWQFDIHFLRFLWIDCPGHAGVKGNDWADRLAGKYHKSMACLIGQKCWGPWDTIYGHKATSHHQLTGGESCFFLNVNEALNDLPWNDEKELSSIRQTLERFQRQHWRTSGAFPERVGAILNWTMPLSVEKATTAQMYQQCL